MGSLLLVVGNRVRLESGIKNGLGGRGGGSKVKFRKIAR